MAQTLCHAYRFLVLEELLKLLKLQELLELGHVSGDLLLLRNARRRNAWAGEAGEWKCATKIAENLRD